MSLFAELKRRNVLRIGAAYLVAAWLIVQVSATLFPVFGFDPSAVRITVILLAIGFLPALIFAWKFELGPEGLKRESEVGRGQSITPRTGKMLDRIITLVLALALGYFAFDKFVLDPIRQESRVESARQEGRSAAMVESYGEKSIAVLPFLNIGGDLDNEYFSDGLAEELLNLLSRLTQLRVVSRSSSFALKGQQLSAAEVGRKLNVSHILEGSVRNFGNHVRITTQLIDTQSDTHLWSESYDRELGNILSLQDEIASQVVAQLQLKLVENPPTSKPRNAEAYLLVLRARHLVNLRSAEWREQSNHLYMQAIALDPAYCEALSGLAYNYLIQPESGSGWDLAKETAKHALTVDTNCALAHVVLGNLASDTDLSLAAEHYDNALSISPNDPSIVGEAADMLFLLGRFEQAATLKQFALARDPLNWRLHYSVTLNCLLAGRYEEAIKTGREAIRLGLEKPETRFLIGSAMFFHGDPQGALQAYSDELSDDEGPLWAPGNRAAALHALGRTEEFYEVFTEFKAHWGDSRPFFVAMIFAMMDDHEAAFEWLRKAEKQGESELRFMFVYSHFNPIRDDPRWDAILERQGTSKAQRDAVQFHYTLSKFSAPTF